MTTVRQLIDHLFTVEDLDEPILYQYYLAEHFGIDTGLEAGKKVWEKVVNDFDSLIPGVAACSREVASAIAEELTLID